MTITGLSYEGVAKVPAATGALPMLKFRMSSLTFSGDARLVARLRGNAAVTNASFFGFRGDVVFYTTEISGTLDGAQFTFTPRRPPSRLGADVTLTDVVAHRPCLSADSLLASGFRIWPLLGEGGR